MTEEIINQDTASETVSTEVAAEVSAQPEASTLELTQDVAPVALDANVSEASVEPAIPTDIQNEADKAAIVASGNVLLASIYKQKVTDSHFKTANLVAKVMSVAKKETNWLFDEVKEIWERIENELKSDNKPAPEVTPEN